MFVSGYQSSARQSRLEDIILYEDKILDGRERYVTRLRKKVPPRFGECASALEFVVSKNLHPPTLDGESACPGTGQAPASFSALRLRASRNIRTFG